MPNWSLKTKVAAVIALFAIYFPIALYLKYSYVPDRAPPGTVAELKRPFFRTTSDGFDYLKSTPELDALADSGDDPGRSPYVIYENDRMLGPAHASTDEVAAFGKGRFVHWRDIGFIFSSSDGTSPVSNGRRYRVVLPPNPEPVPAPSLPPVGTVAELVRPFHKFQTGGLDYRAEAPGLEKFADSLDDWGRSPFLVYEDDRPLGPAHSRAADIHEFGHGRFLHWRDIGFIISSSDGTSPATNRRRYRVVKPNLAPPPAGTAIELERPFSKFQTGGHDYSARAPALDALSDSVDNRERSPYILYENDIPLGPPHSSAADIQSLGHGRFLHWSGVGFIFSSSDGTNPDANGRRYHAVQPTRPNPEPPPAGTVIELERPFSKFQTGGYDYSARAPALDALSDSVDNRERSPYILYENDIPLGPPHSSAADIQSLGHGRFLHWSGIGFVFSSSDGTNPDANGRRYHVVQPP